MIHSLAPPKDVTENRLYRAWLLQACDTQARQTAVMERSAEDIVWWIDSTCWQYNPDERGHEVEPFICYEFQETALRRTMKRLLEFRLPVLWEKSRKLGATWLAMFLEIHQCLFHKRQKFLNLSHSEQAVYRPDDPDTLFWKMDFIHQHLPDWMTRAVRKKKLTFWYPGTQSSATGAATTERSGVGGRGTVIADEFSKHPKDWEILGQTVDTGPQLFIGTHYDLGSAFYDLSRRPDTYKILMHWTDHPKRRQGRYRSDPTLPLGYEILDTAFVFPPQCPKCSGLTTVRVGEPTPCCSEDEDQVLARPYCFITDGKPTGGPHPGIRSPAYDFECVKRANERDMAMHWDINPQGSQSQFFDSIMLRQRIMEHCFEPYWRGELRCDTSAGRPLRLVPDSEGPLKLWIRPTSNEAVPVGLYGGGSDLSTGGGNTPSVFSLGDAATGLKVLEFATAHLSPERFAPYVTALCWLFHDKDGTPALLAWEANGPGEMFGKTVIGLGYRRLYYRRSEQFFRTATKSDVPGWWSNPSSKRVLFDSYKAALVSRAFVNRSEPALRECSQYRYSDRKDAVEHPKDIGGERPEEARSNHGDRVMADALCWLALEQLGAGRPVALRTEEEPPPIQSFAWRRMRREQQKREAEAWI